MVFIVRLLKLLTYFVILTLIRETNNKALNAINEINLVPFLMSFLGARDKLPSGTYTGLFNR